MQKTILGLQKARSADLLLVICATLIVSACGGGSTVENSELVSQQIAAPLASGTTTLQIDIDTLPDDVATQMVQPSFHIAPMLLDSPDDADNGGHSISAHRSPRRHTVPAEFEGIATRRLTRQSLEGVHHRRHASETEAGLTDPLVTPMAAGSAVLTYSPAQIRAAYGLTALPVVGATLTATQAAQYGAGQTIYIIGAKHNPNVAAELAAFNQKFGLPTCTTQAIAVTATLPLSAAPTNGCQLSIVYNNASGSMVGAAPAYDAGWATEIALDVQWAHATAPLARIILIEAPDASLSNLLGSIKLANTMGSGVVSMSFGSLEGSWTTSVDSAFSSSGMTYLAATGDSGAAVSWPAVSPKVVAVGGTTLSYSGTGTRSEVTWSGTGGGVSLYTLTPSYQTTVVPGMGAYGRRSVADVAFNADPATGQYVAVMTPPSTAVNWISAGGTSLATPQWAGLFAIANAARALSAKAALGAPHAVLYSQIAAVPGTYASAFADVTKGLNGNCSTCLSKIGYDTPTGLGTPNVSQLVSALSGAIAPATAPVVTPANISGQVGTALTFTATATSANALTYSLTGAPSGMAITASGIVSWASPVAGTYSVTVVVKDSKTGLSGQGVYTVTIAAPIPPVLTSASISGIAGTALSFTATAISTNPVAYALSGAPSGMTINAAGAVSWTAPVVGKYTVTVTAKDSKTGLSGQGVYTVTIAAQSPPVVVAATVNGKLGTALSFSVSVTTANPVNYSLTGAPVGMSIASTGVVSWASPVIGSYNVTVTAKDSKTGLSGQGLYTVIIAKAGPSITASATSGVAGKALSGSIVISAPGASSLSISITGAPLGMGFSASGLTINYFWNSPVTGSYSLKVSVTDSSGAMAQATIPITVTAK